MKTKHNYNIHDVVKISTNVEGFFPEHFKVYKNQQADLEIIETNFEFEKKSYNHIGSFYGNDKTIYFESKIFGIPIYRILIKDLDGKTKLYFTKTTNRIFNIQKLVFLLLQIKLLQKNCTLLHAGGVSKDGKGIVVFGWPGVGKSSTLFGLMKNQSFRFFGDDSIIISDKKQMYAYPQRMGVFYKSENLDALRLSPLKMFELSLRYLISKIPPFNRYIGAKLMVDISNIAKFESKTKLEKVYFLETGRGKTLINKPKAINRIISSTIQSFFDHYLSNKMFYAYCYLTGFDPGYVEKSMRKILEKTLKKNSLILRSDKKEFHKYFLK